MKPRIARPFIAAVLLLGRLVPAADAQPAPFLYLLSGTSGTEAKLPVTLLRVSSVSESTPDQVREVSQGIDCVLADYDHRRLVVGYPALAPKDFTVIRMDAPSKITTIRIPYDANELLPAGIYLLDLPKKGVVIALALDQLWRKPFVYPKSLTAASLEDTGSPPVDLPLDAWQYIRLGGRVGGGLTDERNAPWVGGNPLKMPLPGTVGVSSGLTRPPYLGGDPDTRGYPLLVSNDAIAVIVGAPQTLDIFNRASGEWHRVSIPFRSYRARAFGAWIGAIAEDLGSLAGVSAQQVNNRDRQARIAEFHEKNPGGAKRRTEIIPGAGGRYTPMTVDDLFQGDTAVFPGKLLVYNALTGFMATISTGQADSEILLISETAVFYRVNDEIFSSAINGGELGKPLRLASGDKIYQVHWAFLSKASE